MSKQYKINKRTIVEYRTNQKEEIFAGSKLNKAGFPEYWPTRNNANQVVFISFVDAQIFDLKGQPVDNEIANFDILDSDEFHEDAENANQIIKFISALLSPEYRVKGGVYFKGEFYTGQMKKAQADKLNEVFMAKYFHVQDREMVEKYFPRNEKGFFPYWPTKGKINGKKIIFSAVDATISKKGTNELLQEGINFDLEVGKHLDPNAEEDKLMVETIMALLNPNFTVSGFYYKGRLVPNVIDNKQRWILAKGFIKKNFAVEDLEYLKANLTLTSDKGELIFMPMHNKALRPIACSFRDGSTPLGEEYNNFDIYYDEEFNPSLKVNQDYIRIIEAIINKEEGFSGTLYLDGVLIPGKEKPFEIERRKNKVEKYLRVRIDGNPDYLKIFNTFTTDDREKLLLLSNYHRTSYPDLRGRVENYRKDLFKNKIKLVFDRVNILNEKGEFLFKEDYSAEYQVLADDYKFNEQEKQIVLELFTKQSYVRGGVFLNGKNLNRKRWKLFAKIDAKKLAKYLDKEYASILDKSFAMTGVPYLMDKKSGMPVHWPVFDKNGKEVVLSVSDADVWFKVSRTIVKAANNMNMNIYAGETFGLVGESGSGKTTISRAILGINKLRKGGIYWKGFLISSGLNKRQSKSVKNSIQMIFQDPAASLNERANIDYIVSEGLYNFHLYKNKEERLSKVINMLREVGLLPEHLSRYPHEFSGGQRQRIGIARALVIEPELVLADEPISALDVSIRAQVLNLLRKLQKEQDLTYLFIAHDLSIIRYISDRIAVMHNGFIVELGLAEEIYSNPLHPYTKSLLTAIPQPDPKSKDKRVKLVYEQGDLDYGACRWVEMRPGHFVLVNDELEKEIKERLK